jgi:hypothetical protein
MLLFVGHELLSDFAVIDSPKHQSPLFRHATRQEGRSQCAFAFSGGYFEPATIC